MRARKLDDTGRQFIRYHDDGDVMQLHEIDDNARRRAARGTRPWPPVVTWIVNYAYPGD